MLIVYNTPNFVYYKSIKYLIILFLIFATALTKSDRFIVHAQTCSLLGDIDCSGRVNAADLGILLLSFGSSNPQSDLDSSGLVNAADITILLQKFGQSPSPQPTNVASPTPSRAPTIAPTVTTAPSPTGQIKTDPSFSCLSQAGPLQEVTGSYTTGKFEPVTAPNKKFDARTASFEIPADISWGKIMLRGDTSPGMCWAGGYITASPTWHDLDISWDQSKNGQDGTGTFRNTTSAESFHDTMTWTGMHIYNVHDGIRTSNSNNNWTIQHLWLDYIRDDCVEDDHIYSGKIYDSLFDGCYVGISTRPSSSHSSAGQTIIIDKVLMRMEPMPYPYKWDSKSDPVVYAPGYTIPGTSDPLPFGFGNVFKMEAGNEPNFKVTNSVFLLEYNSQKDLFPPKTKVTECRNNTILWFDTPASAPNHLLTDFPGCFTIITDKTVGKALWKSKVVDWHSRHPGVDADKKPTNPGTYTWPRY